jgi:hypothetical protein
MLARACSRQAGGRGQNDKKAPATQLPATVSCLASCLPACLHP